MTSKTFDLIVGGFRLTLPALESGPDYVPKKGDVLAYPKSNPLTWRIIEFHQDHMATIGSMWAGGHIVYRAPRLREVPFTLPTGQKAVLIGEDRGIAPNEWFFPICGDQLRNEEKFDGSALLRTTCGIERVPKAGARIEVRP